MKDSKFVHRRTVMWGETDVAGSVDLSTVVRYTMEALEHWFRDRLGVDWYQLHVERRLASPFVRAELEFHNPVKPTDALAVLVEVEKLGRSSVMFHVIGRAEGRDVKCWEGRFTSVFLNPDTAQSVLVPDPFRGLIESELA